MPADQQSRGIIHTEIQQKPALKILRMDTNEPKSSGAGSRDLISDHARSGDVNQFVYFEVKPFGGPRIYMQAVRC